jgi:uncharacterized protein YndB with AHSA1/START domain
MVNRGALTVTTPTDREIVMTRVFKAPRSLVFEAMTTPELLRRWFVGPPGWSLVVCEVDFRVGGGYRYVWRKEDGTDIGMHGVYRQVAPPERIVQTEVFDQTWYPGDAIATLVLIEEGDKTLLTMTVLYDSQATRDAVLMTPMAEGMAAAYDNLADLLPSLM